MRSSKAHLSSNERGFKATIGTLVLLMSACASTSSTDDDAVGAVRAAAAPVEVQKKTVVYSSKAGQPLQLDRYMASGSQFQGKRPVLIYSVGGGWETGDRADRVSVEFLQHFASLGYVVVSIDYRLGIKHAKQSGEMTPANIRQSYLRAIRWGVEDLYDATAYVLKHADEWNVDANRIVIVGSSAGATNSLVAEFNVANQTKLATTHLPATFRYAGVISMAGAFWLEDNTPLVWKQQPAPIMFVHGGKDQLVTYEADEKHSAYGPVYAQQQFTSQGYSSWFIDVPEADHVMSFAGLVDYRSEMEAFLTKMVWERQEISVHTIEKGKVTKTFGNLAALYRRYLPPELLKVLDGAKQ